MHYQRLMRHGSLEKPKRPHADPLTRFWAKVNKDGPVPEHAPHLGPCWLWRPRSGRGGYAYFFRGPHLGLGLAHRWIYGQVVGPIPEGLTLDHLCRVRNCVNPAHLEPVTHEVNVRRGESPSTVTARTGVCQRGHAMTPDNVYVSPSDGARACRECRNLSNRARRQRNKRP